MKLLSISLLFVVFTILQYSEQHVDDNTFNQFSGDVYKELKQSHEGNFVASPIVTQILLAMFYSGPNSQMSRELSTALHLPTDKQVLHENFKTLTSNLQGNDKYILTNLIKLYVAKQYTISESFKELAKDVYNVEVDSIDFSNTEEAVVEINRWINEKTHGKITNMLSSSLINANTAFYFNTGIFMRASWRKPFSPLATINRKFYISSDKKTEVPMLSTVARFNYYKSDELKAKFLEMRFEGEDLSMTFVLPYKREGLKVLGENIHSIFTTPRYDYQRVKVQIPKFKVQSKIDYRRMLEEMGVRNIFSDSSEISQIVDGVRFKLTSVTASVFLELKEGGVNVQTPSSVPIPSASSSYMAEFIADHPFLYYVKDKDTIIFIGRYVSP